MGNSPNLESGFRCQMPKKNNKCQLFSAVRPGYQKRLEESHFPHSSRSSQISFHLSDIHYFLINAFTLGCSREHGYSQSAKHMIIHLLQPQIACYCQRFPYQLHVLLICLCPPWSTFLSMLQYLPFSYLILWSCNHRARGKVEVEFYETVCSGIPSCFIIA